MHVFANCSLLHDNNMSFFFFALISFVSSSNKKQAI